MKKVLKTLILCLALGAGIWTGSLLRDRRQLDTRLIRLHVVADSDSPRDQELKLRVRDAVTASLEEGLRAVGDRDQAYAYLQENLQKLQDLANATLRQLGSGDCALVTLCREKFDTRYYDTFTLPAGIYDALRITIGEGRGHNWWCVAYPGLCLPAVSRQVDTVAASAGLSRSLRGAMLGERPYGVRFYLLDLLGRLSRK